jgi:endogenous inhibitor of DNA gyrase (YacG/DUF329 family)
MSDFRQFQYKLEEQHGWKSYPVRVVMPEVSRCCQAPRLLVQSMTGGFITANCLKCGHGDKDVSELKVQNLHLWVSCPECRSGMQYHKQRNNHGYACSKCQLFVKLADLLPDWSDIMPIGELR